MYDSPLAKSHDKAFRQDPLLNYMIETKTIRDYALTSFKTFGTSRYWIHEAEVPSYRYLILNEITNDDFSRGHAWLLDAGKINSQSRG